MAIQFQYQPREYQHKVLDYFARGGKRAMCIWHRGAGKDLTFFNLILMKAIFERVGTYFYFFPTYAQGKKVIWDGIDNDGKSFLSYIPDGCLVDKSENEMQLKIRSADGTGISIIQIIGTDKYDSIRGTNPIGVVLSEFRDQNKAAYEVIEPRLGSNGGWAAFVTTPRGHNHVKEYYDYAKTQSDWFHEILTIEDTKKEDGSPVVPAKFIESLRGRGVDEDFIQQEYYCSFSGSITGSYYGKLIQAAREQTRITRVPWEPSLRVETYWDIGRDDRNAIWFAQRFRRELRLIDYLEGSGEGLPYYARMLRDGHRKDYDYEFHGMPHDIEVHEYSTNRKRSDAARLLGIKPIRVAPKMSVDEGIDMVRRTLPRCYFDSVKCHQGLKALEQYHKEWDEDKQTFRPTPVHDWASNGADAFRVLGLLDRDVEQSTLDRQLMADSQHNPFAEQYANTGYDFHSLGRGGAFNGPLDR